MIQLQEQQWQLDQSNISKIIQIPQQIHSTIRNNNLIITQKQFPATIFHVTSNIINDSNFQFFIQIHYFLCELNLTIQSMYDLSLFWYLFKLFAIKLKVNYNEDEVLQLIQILITKDLMTETQTHIFTHSFSIIKLIPQLQEQQITKLFSMFPTIQPKLFQCNSQINQIIFQKMDLAKLIIIDLSHSSVQNLDIFKDICIQFTSINISNCRQLTSNNLVQFFKADFCNLVDLKMESNFCEDDVFVTIWNNRSMNKLTNLNYANCQIQNPSKIASLFAQINMKQNQILKLNLCNTSINNEILVAIQWLEKLQSLDISKNPQITSTFELKREKSYEYLNISYCSISKHEMDKFLSQSYLNNTVLLMHGIQVNQTQFNKSLRGLHLDGNAKFDSTNLPMKLQYFTLREQCNLQLLHQSFIDKQFECLIELDLSKLAIDDTIIKQISELVRLQKLILNGCKMITDDGIKNLKNNLLHLELDQTNITDLGLQLLKPLVLSLDILSIRECCNLTEQCIEELIMCFREYQIFFNIFRRRLKIYISGKMGM